ncbi:MAG TPA: carboxypeptidase regulatory-like domain-containing protein [bacterium]|jgi:hypothetical protein
MLTTCRASLLTLVILLAFSVGACSGGGSPVEAGTGPDQSHFASSISGTVFYNSAPVASGHVFAYDLETYELANETNINSNGSFNLGLDEGQYVVIPVTSSAWRQPILSETFSNYVNIGTGNDYRMDFPLTSELPSGEEIIFGFVTSTENDLPIVGASVAAAGRTAKSDGYGFYFMTVPAGTANFNVSAPGFNTINVNIRQAQGNQEFWSTPFFNLSPTNTVGGSIGGVVRDVTDGTGLGGVRITLSMPGDPLFADIQYLTNLGGQYRFYNLAEGIYRVKYERPGYSDGTRDGLVIKDQDDAIINVFMNVETEGRGEVSGVVRNAGVPLPVSNARVSLSNPLLGSKTAITGPTGSYKIEAVVPGDYTVTVTAPGEGVTFYEAQSTYQTIREGTNQLDFALRFINEGVLRGNIFLTDSGSGPFAFPPTGVDVTAEKLGGPLTGVKWKTNSDGKGQFVFNGIPAGTYIVQGNIVFSTDESYFGQVNDVLVNAGVTTNIDLELAIE